MTLSQFISDYGITAVVKRIDKRTDAGGESFTDPGTRHFEMTLISTQFGPMSQPIEFSQGSAHTQDPTAENLLECLHSDTSDFHFSDGQLTFEEFADTFGYDSDSRKAERIYKACKREFCQLESWMGSATATFYECEESE